MTTAAQRRVFAAMADQLDRVNSAPERLRERLAEAEAERDHYRRLFEEARARLAALEDGLQSAPPARRARRKPSRRAASDQPLIVNGRPTLSVAQAAAKAGVSIATVSRYCQHGHWQAVRTDGYHWRVYSDQVLRAKPARSSGR